MMNVAAYAAPAASAPLEKITIARRDVRETDVAIEIDYAGICHSDIHTVRDEWGQRSYPLVPGHEIVGRVTEVGPDVTKVTVGDVVGVGCMVDSCRRCSACDEGLENYCLDGNIPTYGGIGYDGEMTQGGYSTNVVVEERFVVRIPQALQGDKLAATTPLLCAGITLYCPAAALGCRPWQQGRHHRHGRPRPHGRQDRRRHGR